MAVGQCIILNPILPCSRQTQFCFNTFWTPPYIGWVEFSISFGIQRSFVILTISKEYFYPSSHLAPRYLPSDWLCQEVTTVSVSLFLCLRCDWRGEGAEYLQPLCNLYLHVFMTYQNVSSPPPPPPPPPPQILCH